MGEKKRRLRSGLGPLADAQAATLDAVRLLQTGHADRALRLYRMLLEQKITDPDALHRLGFVAIQFDEPDRAEGFLRTAIAAVPEQPRYRNTMGIALRHQRKFGQAIEMLRQALAHAPDQHEIWSNLGNVLRDEGRFAEAANAYQQALKLAPDIGYYWSAFSTCLRYIEIPAPVSADFRSDLLGALTHPEVSPADVASAALAIIKSDPAMRRLVGHVQDRACDAGVTFTDLLSDPAIIRAFADPLLLRLLESTVVADVELELVLTAIRRLQLLSLADTGRPLLAPEAAAALARQCFLNDYAWLETAEETETVATVAARSSAESPPYWIRLATLAAYRPLQATPGIEPADGPPCALDLYRQQVAEPAEERRLRSEIRVLAEETGEVSRAVRDQYESNPYPRWSRTGRYEHARPAPEVLGELFPGRDFRHLPRSGARILVAGCGTGRHAIQAALRFAEARVLAIDLSLASLAYALRKTREMGLTNIEYCRADILAMDGATERFDIVESVGVLHHLRQPLEGWRALLDRLGPGGVMRVGLYSELARRHVVHGQALAASLGISGDAAALRKFRRTVIESRDEEHLRQITRSEDFFSLSGCRDLLLHVQEHRFVAGDLAAMLLSLKLDFLGFELQDPAIAKRYRKRFPEDRTMTDLANWEQFEHDEPDAFFGMYDFWVRRQNGG
jgi:SAM-dependent methyltransferase